ncbi:type III secretion system export apparatus subunit SctT [Iodobacter ciconiae]|uniref:SpaR/YscT/HrcT type III secretion system export apparatus protein n=1 Tax=Iodobacter ciconiae TaxID=2496266 RepID=A0A3S8ZQZ6_9NEIS|nr:type III secretion system export apparatus subunit SctT [Iodobacter ciconiae]AZN35899.1 SpaR/YscT/HrcT type III secretion system export apparatus protein [Iodobacter ciconiae]
MQYGLFFDVHDWLAAAAMGFARIGPVFFMLPFLNSNVLTGVVRITVSMLVSMSLWPYPPGALPEFNTLWYLGMMSREVMVGSLLGCLLSWPFWVFHALGSIIDNQRGATLSSSIDPANGVDTPELANLLNIFAAVVYLQGGGLTLLLEVMASSYQLCGPLKSCTPELLPVLGMLTKMAAKALVLASPVVAALLLSEFTLGLLSRFAPQMNAFSISLTVKSGIALLILLLYFSPVLPDVVGELSLRPDILPVWLH